MSGSLGLTFLISIDYFSLLCNLVSFQLLFSANFLFYIGRFNHIFFCCLTFSSLLVMSRIGISQVCFPVHGLYYSFSLIPL